LVSGFVVDAVDGKHIRLRLLAKRHESKRSDKPDK
jgi:hypothetical protein